MNENAYTWRYSSLGLIIFLLPVMITLQLIRIQINPGWVKEVMEFGERFEKEAQFIDPPRGQILDRKGNLLAGNQIVYEVGIDLPKVVDPRSIATVLSSILDIDYEDVYSAASLEASDRAVYAVVADYLPQEKIDKLNIFIEQLDSEAIASPEKGLLNLAGIVKKPHLGRLYPERMIGSNFMGFSHVPNVGYFGVEEQYNDILSRPRETIWVPVNPLLAEEQTDVPSGSSLILTVDRAVQKSKEELVDATEVETGTLKGPKRVFYRKKVEVRRSRARAGSGERYPAKTSSPVSGRSRPGDSPGPWRPGRGRRGAPRRGACSVF